MDTHDVMLHLCWGCMEYLDQPDLPCPWCGWDKEKQNSLDKLRAGLLLEGK